MPSAENKRKRMLAELATQLLDNPEMELEEIQSGGSSFAQAETPLSEIELQELSRIQKALTFLHGSDQSISHPEIESRGASSDETLTSRKSGEPGSAVTPASLGQIARFQIVELVGSGGFSEVFRAYDPTLNRDVALKVLTSNSRFTDEAIVRFQREAQAAGILNHPNIVPVYEQWGRGRAAVYRVRALRWQDLEILVRVTKPPNGADVSRRGGGDPGRSG